MGGWIPFERKDDYVDEYREHRMRRLCSVFCVLLCALLVFVVVVLGLATLIAYLILRPHATHYTVVSATIPTLEILGDSNSLTATSTINAQFIYGVEFRNPNGRVTMEYDKLHIQTTYLGTDIGHSGTSLGRVRVGHRSNYIATIATSAPGVVVNNIVGNAFRDDISQQSVTVQVRIDTRARAHVGSYTSFWMWLHSACVVTVSPPSAGVAGALVQANCHNT
ncbi:hypothetical protein M758_3G002000 [Ceratodon purpureus]|uniref:Late embryogenesis abundant protein LEA-2 subgroup domain-containing protein n=1 Tax=Ceratodon purpureus TaxID=3225 RepID=A0A8T0IFR2_CERPU|nr:hypothetical protein KC19_3G004300 [Ceratodon purpureus]KAG0621207.1 hypothetical protein M758_3G002000 [Ceratodon purpureus]